MDNKEKIREIMAKAAKIVKLVAGAEQKQKEQRARRRAKAKVSRSSVSLNGPNAVEERVRKIRIDLRACPERLMEKRPGFTSMSYAIQCQVSDEFAMERLRRWHIGFNYMKV